MLVDLTTVTLGVMFTILNERNLRADFNNRKAIQEQKDKIETASMELNSVFATIHESIISFDHGLKIKIASNELEKVFGRINDVASLIEKFEIDKDNISLCLESLRSIAGESEINKTINEQHLLKNCRYRGRSYTLNWTFIYDHQDVCVGGVVSISDETEKILKESIEEAANQKADRMMTKIKTLINGNIKSGQLFLKESLNLVTDLLDLADLSRVDRHPVLLRNVHTIKGAGRVLKMNDVKLLAHEIESSYKEGQYPDVRSKCSLLISELKEYNQALDSFLVGEVRTLSIFDVVHSLKDDFTERLRAARIGYRGLSVSDELGPVPHEIKECILHGLTNAVDHGFILPSARGLSVNAAFIKVECRREGGLNFVFIRDNGVGIDWEKIRDICRKKGYAAKPDRPATDVLFLDGVTTAAEVSTTSGRGIGMGAIKDAVEAIGGDVKLVDNDQNHGSMLVISWPVEGRVAFHADGKVVA
ncbi:MAG TPA: Hpt domain-containing protein [Oligoflexus sp.]|uniref:Hpt domain-containing protein n=1 Tax=Oligoflexus sp. TaxID=1971216 RepID=UPI002D7EA524|nr:Hpt domain-containing protein [Oligoflexus sp.]HET9239095.1 Hpt domain-containing protein [Oligoflexus sp.]